MTFAFSDVPSQERILPFLVCAVSLPPHFKNPGDKTHCSEDFEPYHALIVHCYTDLTVENSFKISRRTQNILLLILICVGIRLCQELMDSSFSFL